MEGLREEGSEVLEEADKSPIRDAALISAAQWVEHYEMAGYGSVREYAKLLAHSDIASLLEKTLEEEKAEIKNSTVSLQGSMRLLGLRKPHSAASLPPGGAARHVGGRPHPISSRPPHVWIVAYVHRLGCLYYGGMRSLD